MTSYIGSYLGHYKILGHLGSGATSDVYLGYDESLQLHVAIKVVSEAATARPEMIERFKQEARATARLNHPNVARVFYFNFQGETPFFAMELVEGVSLADVLERRMRVTLRQLFDIFEQAMRGLRAAAVRGIVHRDIKPGNLMVGRDGLAKVVDFGLAKVGDDQALTQTGTMMGTPYYLSPEAVRGDTIDLRSDIYSLGVTMFQTLVGYPPYDADTPYGLMMQHVNAAVPDPRDLNPQLPRPLCELIVRMLDKEPDERFPNYEALVNAMAQIRELVASRLDEELNFCVRCDVNTLAEGDRCTRCGKGYSSRVRPEAHDLILTGFRDGESLEACTRYISKAVGRRPENVRRALVQLPFKLGHRLPFDRAKQMQRQFYEIGGEVEMRHVEDPSADEGSPGRLEFVSAAAARTASFIAPIPRSMRRRSRRFGPRTLAGLGLVTVLLLAVAALGVRVWGPWRPDPDDLTDAPTPAEANPLADGEAATAEPVEGETPAPPPLLQLDVELIGEVPDETVGAVVDAVQAAAERLGTTCSWQPQVRMRIVLDQARPYRTVEDDRAWELVLGGQLERFPVGTLDPADGTLEVSAAHWIAHRAVLDLAGPEAPAWIALGLAFHQEARIKGLDPAPFLALAEEEGQIPVTFWGASPGRNPPENIARAQSMVEFLVDRWGNDRFRDFLIATRSGSLDEAFEGAFGEPAGDVQEGWALFLRTRYGGLGG